MSPADWAESLNQGFPEPPPAALDGLLVSRPLGEDPAHLNPDSSISEPAKPVIRFSAADLDCNFIGDRININPSCHRGQLPMPRRLPRRCLAVEIDGPSLEFGSGRADDGPAMPLDDEGQRWRVPLDVFHTTQELVTGHSALITVEIVPDLGKQALKLCRLITSYVST